MGTDIELVSPREMRPSEVDGLRQWFEFVESHLSRFRPRSELSMLNASAGRPFIASELLTRVLSGALKAAEQNDGVFDPTILPDLEAAGYKRSYEELGAIVERGVPSARGGWRAVDITSASVVTLPEGFAIDLGGYAKGWTVDQAAAFLPSNEGWLLNAGGDILAHGAGPDGNGWLIGVEDPFTRGQDLLVIRVQDRAVATSTTMRRRWMTSDGQPAHHLIDPRTGRPSESDLASVTVVGRSVADSEVLAKVLLILGRRDALIKAQREDIVSVFIDYSGEPTIVGSEGAFDIA
jgi:thiamine biosynthesis lipoprotein